MGRSVPDKSEHCLTNGRLINAMHRNPDDSGRISPTILNREIRLTREISIPAWVGTNRHCNRFLLDWSVGDLRSPQLNGEHEMSRIALAAATVLSLTAGAALAQSTTETTTTQSTVPYIPAPPPAVSQTTTQRTVDPNGMVTDHTRTVTTGTSVGPYGDTTTTKRTVESTTSR
jgi:hypothetical protein